MMMMSGLHIHVYHSVGVVGVDDGEEELVENCLLRTTERL